MPLRSAQAACLAPCFALVAYESTLGAKAGQFKVPGRFSLSCYANLLFTKGALIDGPSQRGAPFLCIVLGGIVLRINSCSIWGATGAGCAPPESPHPRIVFHPNRHAPALSSTRIATPPHCLPPESPRVGVSFHTWKKRGTRGDCAGRICPYVRESIVSSTAGMVDNGENRSYRPFCATPCHECGGMNGKVSRMRQRERLAAPKIVHIARSVPHHVTNTPI